MQKLFTRGIGYTKFKKIKWYFGWMPPHPTVFVRKEIYESLGSFNHIDYKIAADYELMLRFFVRNNLTVKYLQKVVVSMELGGESNKNFKNRLRIQMNILSIKIFFVSKMTLVQNTFLYLEWDILKIITPNNYVSNNLMTQ